MKFGLVLSFLLVLVGLVGLIFIPTGEFSLGMFGAAAVVFVLGVLAELGLFD
jgi:hypothetical protein